MKIRRAFKSDIPFIVNAILEIEKTENLNTYSNLFSVDNQTAFNYLEQIFLDDENLHTELSLNTFTVAEIDGILAGCCSHIFTDQEYYLNKSEIFPVHLNNPDRQNFIKNALTLNRKPMRRMDTKPPVFPWTPLNEPAKKIVRQSLPHSLIPGNLRVPSVVGALTLKETSPSKF